NRELGPGEAIATVHDTGGLAAMAVGTAQVRFESVVPVSQLDAVLRVEALRLRAPNLGRELWLKSLAYARNDEHPRTMVPLEAAAAAWQDPGMGHDGRVVGKELGDMLDNAVGAQLARLYDYRIATLVVVGPDDPQALLGRVEPLFADLPARPRRVVAPAKAPASNPGSPRVLKLPRHRGDSLLWPVPGDPQARAWAQVLCGTINRQQRADGEGPKAQVRCTFADDPRRPLLLLRAVGYDLATGPEPLIAARLDRIRAVGEAAAAGGTAVEPALEALIEAQRARMQADISFNLRTPLELAAYLASASEQTLTVGARARPLDVVTGLPLLPTSTGAAAGTEPEPGVHAAALLIQAIPSLLDTRAALLVIDPELELPPALARPGDQPRPDQPRPDQPGPDQPAPAQPAPAPAEKKEAE
ncbi:MAG: hypothetical protein KC457_12180, partial [Myxococcales bacterium]|nr:hypothetical protein [Myxococcales bacterium]